MDCGRFGDFIHGMMAERMEVGLSRSWSWS